MSRVRASRTAHKPVGPVLGAVSGTAPEALSRRTWWTSGRDEDIPNTTGEDPSWRGALLAVALRGAPLTGVEAAVDRVRGTA
ncbi:putative protein OS=Streptomyces griseomycini OX=66895 GN=FHS37_006577 PE=4 SV=1 [Streptomyces griseomycini]